MGTLSVDKILKTSTGAAEFTLPATDGTVGQVWQTDGSGQLSVATVPTTGIADDAVTNAKIATDAVTATEIAANAVTTTEIIDNAVTGSKIAMGSDTIGDVLYYNGTDYVRLAAGAADQVFTSAGAAAPTWTAAAGGGKVNQVVSVFKSDSFTSTSTSMTDVTGISAAITPSAADSKVLITVSMVGGGQGGQYWLLRLKRVLNSVTTYPGVGDAAGSRTPCFFMSASASNYAAWSINFTYLDSPASVLESTYNVQCMVEGGTLAFGRNVTDTDTALFGRMGSSITLTEILA